MNEITDISAAKTKRKHASPRHPRFAVAGDVFGTVRVTLAGGTEFATLDRGDFLDLLNRGVSRNWTANRGASGRVSVRAPATGATGNLLGVARLIMRPAERQVVRFRDGDPTNLCRENLYLGFGQGWRDDDAELRRAVARVE